MSHLRTTFSRFRLLSTLTLLAVCLVPALSARAASYVYGSRQRTINAAVLTVSGEPDSAPLVFYVLNQRLDIKPFGWRLANPLAPGGVSAASPAYWEVPLSGATADQLRQYDVLYLPVGGFITPADSEKLRKYVSGGGQLWVESAATAAGPALSAALISPSANGTALALPATVIHPLLTQPFFLTATEWGALGAEQTGVVSDIGAGPGAGDFVNLYSTVLGHTSGASAISAGQLGAGQIVVSGLNIGGAIVSAPTSAAIKPDLKFLVNLISWEEAHPAENKTSYQNAAGNAVASYAPAWTDTHPSQTAPAVYGNYIFVMDTTGTLRAFDANAQTQPVVPLWVAATNLGANASAPTVASFNGQTLALAEKSNGAVYAFNAATGAAFSPALLPNSGGNTAFSGQTPSPSVYDGKVYAGQPDNTLYVYSLNGAGTAGTGAKIPLETPPYTGSPEPVAASPAVSALAHGPPTDDIVAFVPTTSSLYTVFLGSRSDQIQPYPGGGSPIGYNVNRNRLNLYNLVVDSGNPKTYLLSGGDPLGLTFNPPGNPDWSAAGALPTPPPAYYADYDANLDTNTGSLRNHFTLNMNVISAFSFGAVAATGVGSPNGAYISSPAIDRSGDLYYAVNASGFSYLFGVHESSQFQNVQVKFRFRMPVSTDGPAWNFQDADNTDYSPLIGYTFVGSPVVDGQGHVYVAAQTGAGNAAVLCFNGYGDITGDINSAIDPSRAQITQQDEATPQTNTLQRGPNDPAQSYGQYRFTGSGVTFYNFGVRANGGSLQNVIAGNMTEPEPLSVQSTDTTGATTGPFAVPLHTNLLWYTTFSLHVGSSGISGLTKVGNSLYLSVGGSLYKLSASPTIGAGKVATPTLTALPLNIGAVTATPSAGGGALVVSGAAGVANLTQQFTLVTDNNRILETDSDGNAVWGLDATVQATPTGSSRMDFNRPTYLSQVATNDFLVADTGNNRCVRFDRDGNVLWELSHFQDTGGLMTAGEPTSLSQPTSVQVWQRPDPSGNVLTSYLIADSGNHRVVEVTDTVSAAGVPVSSHVLTWVTHTHDQQSRQYRYGSATYFPAGTATVAPQAVIALVTNTRIAADPVTHVPGLASGDAPGGSIVQLNYGGAGSGLIAGAYGSFQTPAGTTFNVRNPRFVASYPPAAGAIPSVLYADDNGAFDLTYSMGLTAFVATGLQFMAADYQAMARPVLGVPYALAPRTNAIPFVPSNIQRIGTDVNGNPRYLITQAGSQPDLGHTQIIMPNPIAEYDRIGGEVFEVDGSNTPVGGYGGGTLSRPGLTGPLTQPTAAIRIPSP